MKKLAGQTAVVTGAAQGLGLGIATRLANDGAYTVMVDVQADKVAAAAEELKSQQMHVEAAALDITDSDAVDVFFASQAAARGTIDVLVNNAGLGQDVARIVNLSNKHWDDVLRVTLTGTFYCCRAAAQIMEHQESGSIVNVSSINGQSPAAMVAAYNVAKAGVISLSKTLAMEMAAYGVRVNVICPGPVYTDFNRRVMAQRCDSLGIEEQEMIERVRQAIPLGRWGEPQDIAHVVSFLAGPDAAWITNEVLRVSGGLEGVSAAPPKAGRDEVNKTD